MIVLEELAWVVQQLEFVAELICFAQGLLFKDLLWSGRVDAEFGEQGSACYIRIMRYKDRILCLILQRLAEKGIEVTLIQFLVK